MRSIKPIFKVLLIISIIMHSCINERIETAVIIESSSDTIKIDSTYSAELYLKHNNKLHPADYYILFMQDTFLLDYNHLKKCANFNAQPNSIGEKVYKGFATFENRKTKKLQQDFTIKFFVRQ